MGVVTVSSSASRTTLGLDGRFLNLQCPVKKPIILAFKTTKNKDALVAPHESTPLPVDTSKRRQKRSRSVAKSLKTEVRTADLQVPVQQDAELDYTEAAAKLENIYKLSPSIKVSDLYIDELARQGSRVRRKSTGIDEDVDKGSIVKVVSNRLPRVKRLSLDKRIELKQKVGKLVPFTKNKREAKLEDEKIEAIVRDYSRSTDLVSLDWRSMKIPQVLPSSDQAWLFKLMQPSKAILKMKENLQKELDRQPTDKELGEAMGMTASQVKKQMEIGLAARNKLIKHNLRLVLFAINKHFQEFVNGPRFQDLCQAGVSGLIVAIDRFEHKRKFRLSTYSLFWIRHAIIRSMTVSSFTRVPFGLESVRIEIQRAKQELMQELKRLPTEEEIVKRASVSQERYNDVIRASRPVFSLNARNSVTQEELINNITDIYGAEGDNRRQPALARLALDDVLDSLKPKESLVIRQRYGLDGKGERTLGEIAGNLNISREMVRQHEMKALMKLKHPARVDYLRRHLSQTALVSC